MQFDINETYHQTGLPVRTRVLEHVRIPMADGAALSARIWLPEGADDAAIPAIVEYRPYRKRDVTAFADSLTHGYLSAHGYACVRVDMRGTGDSDGVQRDYMAAGEVDDGVNLINWVASQPWCDGNVGVIGLSWAGMNALRIATRDPEPLKCIITVCSTDDRFGNDVHYEGGALLNENLAWSMVLQNYFCRPPAPENIGAGWREEWLKRLDVSEPPIRKWLGHQARDSYWTEEIVAAGRYDDIKCAVYAIGGWYDGYSDTPLRLMRELNCPRKALIGPWQHLYPHMTKPGPGPAIGFLQEVLRWFDQWLKGTATGIMAEPTVRCWMLDSVPNKPYFDIAPGEWVGEDAWPSPNIRVEDFHLGTGGRLSTEPTQSAPVSIKSPQNTGTSGGLWLPEHDGPDLPGDQSEDDGKSLLFETLPLDKPLAFLGTPNARLRVTSDRPTALIAVRLCNVAPDGTSRRISYGVLNLQHRDDPAAPKPLEPGKAYDITVRLHDIGYRVPPGHRLRLALSTSYWPMLWPSRDDATLTIDPSHSFVSLPLRTSSELDAELAPFAPPRSAVPIDMVELRAGDPGKQVTRDLGSGREHFHMEKDDGRWQLTDIDVAFSHQGAEDYWIDPDDPLSAKVKNHWDVDFEGPDWHITISSQSMMTCDESNFHLDVHYLAKDDGTVIFERSWTFDVPRTFV